MHTLVSERQGKAGKGKLAADSRSSVHPGQSGVRATADLLSFNEDPLTQHYQASALRDIIASACELTGDSLAVRCCSVVSASWRRSVGPFSKWFRLLNAAKHVRVRWTLICPEALVSDRTSIRLIETRLAEFVRPRVGLSVRYVLDTVLPPQARKDMALFELRRRCFVAQDSSNSPAFTAGFCTSDPLVQQVRRLLEKVESLARNDSLRGLAD